MTDLISRQAAIEVTDAVWCVTGDKNVAKVWDQIRNLPSAQPKKGKWIVYKAPDAYHCGLCKCPFCGEEMIAEADEYNFCPNCGADMRGEEHE